MNLSNSILTEFEEDRRFNPEKGVTIAFLKGDGESMLELTEGIENLDPDMKGKNGLFMVGLEFLIWIKPLEKFKINA